MGWVDATYEVPDEEGEGGHDVAFEFKVGEQYVIFGRRDFGGLYKPFLFWNTPYDLYVGKACGEVSQEWHPSPEVAEIEGPQRTAYWLHGEPMVMVFEGPDEGMWTACSDYKIARDGKTYSQWVCRRHGPADPCDQNFMKEISS